MKITAIKVTVKTPGRCAIFVDGKYSFSLNETQLLGSGIYVGKELTASDLATLKDESKFGKAYARALDYIVRRPRSEKELRDYAWRKQWEPELIERVIVRLKIKNHLDDQAFSRFWVQNRITGKSTSQRKLRLELSQKGVAKDVIDKVLLEIPESLESDALCRLITKKRKLPRYQDDQKLIEYLVRQGFRYDDAKVALNV